MALNIPLPWCVRAICGPLRWRVPSPNFKGFRAFLGLPHDPRLRQHVRRPGQNVRPSGESFPNIYIIFTSDFLAPDCTPSNRSLVCTGHSTTIDVQHRSRSRLQPFFTQPPSAGMAVHGSVSRPVGLPDVRRADVDPIKPTNPSSIDACR